MEQVEGVGVEGLSVGETFTLISNLSYCIHNTSYF